MMWLDNSNHFVLSNPDISVGSLAGPSQEDLCEPHVIKGSETTFEILYSPVIKYGLNLNKTTIDIRQRGELHHGSGSLRLVFLGQRLLIIFIELLFELFPLIEVVHHLHLLPGVPLVQHPVGGDGLTVVADTAGVILEDGGVIMLFSPALPGKLDITCAL